MTARCIAIATSWAVIDRPYSKESMAEDLLEKTRSGGIVIQKLL
jgi:hypothetical protein